MQFNQEIDVGGFRLFCLLYKQQKRQTKQVVAAKLKTKSEIYRIFKNYLLKKKKRSNHNENRRKWKTKQTRKGNP